MFKGLGQMGDMAKMMKAAQEMQTKMAELQEEMHSLTVTGESACASPENFDAQIGRTIARQNAVNKIWPLMGYELKCRLSREAAE